MKTNCLKCGDLMVSEKVVDFYGANDWKCINCGWPRREWQHFKQSSGCSNQRLARDPMKEPVPAAKLSSSIERGRFACALLTTLSAGVTMIDD